MSGASPVIRRATWLLVGLLAGASTSLAANAGTAPPDRPSIAPFDAAGAVGDAAAAPASTRSLGVFLDGRGGLALPAGLGGALDPRGFAPASKPGELRRFAPKNPVDVPARWDPQFGQAIGCNGTVSAMAAFPDGRIAVGGNFTICGNVLANRVAIWNPSSGTFASLGTGSANGVDSGLLPWVWAIAISGNDIYVGGDFGAAGGTAANCVARFNTGTQAWAALGSGTANGVSGGAGSNCVRALAVSAGSVFVGGFFTQAGGTTANYVARFDAGSQSWAPLGSGAANGVSDCSTTACVLALAVAGSHIYVGGTFNRAGGALAKRVARFDTAAQTWSALGTVPSDGVDGPVSVSVGALAVAGSDIYVGGSFAQAGGSTANNVARFDTTLQSWSALGSGASNGVGSQVTALAASAAEVFVGGSFTQAGGAGANRVARFDVAGQAWTPLGIGAANGASDTVFALAQAGSNVYAGGAFTATGGAPSNRVARFNTGTGAWSPLGAGATNGIGARVNAVAVAGNGIFAGGSFTQAGATIANRIARFDPGLQSWSSLGTGAANGLNGTVYAVAATPADVYVAGTFSLAGGSAANNVARFNVATQTWSSLGNGTANGVNGQVNALVVAGAEVYVGGTFSQAGGAPASRVARFNTTAGTWSTLPGGASNGVNGDVLALAVLGNEIYVGGQFTQAGGAAANRVARFNAISGAWTTLGSGAANGTGCCVYALAVAGGSVYVGGQFTQAGGAAANNVARFDVGAGTWSSLGVGTANGVDGCSFTTFTCVLALAATDSDVYVAGDYSLAGGTPVNRIARFNLGTQAWSALGTAASNGTDAFVNALAVSGSDVYLGGFFIRAGSNFSLRVARYDARRETTSAISASTGASIIVNSPVAFTGTVATSGFPGQPGAVEFLDNGAAIPGCASQSLVGGLDTRTANCATSGLRVGQHQIAARYLGDSLNFIGTSDPVSIEVLPPVFSFSPAVLPGATFNVAGYASGTISVSGAAGTGVIGPASFQVVDAGQLPPGLTAAAQPNGLVITGTPTQAGSFNFTVRATDSSSASVGGPFSSDRQYTLVVARAAQTITPITRVDAVPLDNGVALSDGDFAVQASATSGLAVVIDSTTPTVCQVGAPGSTVRPLLVGTCTLRARQAGNNNYETAADVLRTFQVKATPDVFVSSAPNPSLFPFGAAQPDAVVITASVETPGTATPTGTVRFLRAGNTIAGCAAQPLSGSGPAATASCTTTNLARGANTLTAQYSGDALNVLATSNAATHQLNVGTATGIATITPSPCVVGQGCTVAVAVAAASGTPTGSVQVGSTTGGSCTVTLSAGGGSCALTATTSGTGTVTATYLGSPPWLASPAATQSHPFVATADDLFGNGFEPVVGRPPN